MINRIIIRIVSNGDNEYYQVHLDVLYQPDEVNQNYMDTVWEDCIGQEFFSYLREQEVYQVMSQKTIYRYNIYLDET